MYCSNSQQLKDQRNKITQYQRRIEVTMEKERQLARRLIQEGKRQYVCCAKCRSMCFNIYLVTLCF